MLELTESLVFPIQLNLFGQNTWTALDIFENKYTL